MSEAGVAVRVAMEAGATGLIGRSMRQPPLDEVLAVTKRVHDVFCDSPA